MVSENNVFADLNGALLTARCSYVIFITPVFAGFRSSPNV